MQAAEILRLVSGALQDLEPGIRARWEWNGGDDNVVDADYEVVDDDNNK